MNVVNRDLLWKRFIYGEEKCFKNLFESYYSELFGYGFKLCDDSELVKDAIQDLFTSIWDRRRELDHIEKPTVYLFVSLRRALLNRTKKEKRRKEIRNSTISPEGTISFCEEDLIIKNEMLKQKKEELSRALNHLTNKQKEIIYLHYYNGFSYSEIEEILSINRQSIRNNMYRALQSLRTILDMDIIRLVISILGILQTFSWG